MYLTSPPSTMPKLTFFILTLLFLISSSYAITPDNNDNDNDDFTLLLPSQTRQQKPEQISTVGFTDIFPVEINGPKSTEQTHDRPMRIMRLHPINRHFPVAGRLGSLRMPLHGCHHHKINENHISRLSFGDDMMVASGENGDFDPMVHFEVPERMVRMHHHYRHHHHRQDGLPMFPLGKKHDFFANHKFGAERDEERDWERDGEREDRHDGSFMRSVRKFLNGRF